MSRWLALALLILAAVPALPGPAAAHEYWLAPSRYRAAAGDSIALAAFVGTGFRGEARPYATRRTVRFLARGPAPLDLTRGAENGGLTWARLLAPDSGGLLVASESDFVGIELAAPQFEAYLRLEGLDEVARARASAGASTRPGRERYRRACKTWVAGTSPVPGRSTGTVGLPLELVPAAEPGAGKRLDLTVLFMGRPLAGALVRAWRQPVASPDVPFAATARDSVGPRVSARSDAHGAVSLRLDGPGEWLVSAVHMVPARGREDADWESTWASLTFTRR